MSNGQRVDECVHVPIDDNLAETSDVTLNGLRVDKHDARQQAKTCSWPYLIRVLLLAVLGEGRKGEDTERQDGAEQPHGWRAMGASET